MSKWAFRVIAKIDFSGCGSKPYRDEGPAADAWATYDVVASDAREAAAVAEGRALDWARDAMSSAVNAGHARAPKRCIVRSVRPLSREMPDTEPAPRSVNTGCEHRPQAEGRIQ